MSTRQLRSSGLSARVSDVLGVLGVRSRVTSTGKRTEIIELVGSIKLMDIPTHPSQLLPLLVHFLVLSMFRCSFSSSSNKLAFFLIAREIFHLFFHHLFFNSNFNFLD